MRGLAMNRTNTEDITMHVYHGTPTESIAATTLASAGSETVTIAALGIPYDFYKDDFATNIDAGDVVIVMVRHSALSGTVTMQGSATLKFITR